MVGASVRHGPHHAAHKSSKTGSWDRSTCSAKVASVTINGFAVELKGSLHRPHTGSCPEGRSRRTRLFAPQDGQVISLDSTVVFSITLIVPRIYFCKSVKSVAGLFRT